MTEFRVLLWAFGIRSSNSMRDSISRLFVLLLCLFTTGAAFAAPADDAARSWDEWSAAIDKTIVDAYAAPEKFIPLPPLPDDVAAALSANAASLIQSVPAAETTTSAHAAFIRARAQQALVLELADAVSKGDVDRARVWRARLFKPRGTSSAQGALILQNLPAGDQQRADAAKELVREAITWQTTRARQLLDEAVRSTRKPVAMKHRLSERVIEAMTLADLPADVRTVAGLTTPSVATGTQEKLTALQSAEWAQVTAPCEALRRAIESTLPSLLTPQEQARRERLLLKLVVLVPREYIAGVRDGQITVPLEYREAVTFTAQARQMAGELAPLWLSAEQGAGRQPIIERLESSLAKADELIAAKAPGEQIEAALADARDAMEKGIGINLKRSGSTAEIVEEVLLETRSLLNQSLAAGLSGNWAEAEQLRLEAYTTFDPDLEARLLPRDPQLAIDIETLLLDGITSPGVKALLDRRIGGTELETAYALVNEKLEIAGALLKTGVDPRAAAINAASIVLREGLEGLLVIVAILAGLRGAENRHRRRLMWLGVLASGVVTALTYLLSQTILSQLHAYAETIEAITALLAIGVLLLITNWLFHQIYWNQWVTTLKSQATDGESPWQLVSVGFLIGYREGFETVLFLQSLVMDVGGGPVGIGVAVGLLILVVLGVAALKMGLKLPYFKLLMLTALLIGIVLIAFVGNGVRAMQTIGWLPVHRIASIRWPSWLGQWLGIYNTWETVIAQVLMSGTVIGTWRVSRWKAKRESAQRRAKAAAARASDPSLVPAMAK